MDKILMDHDDVGVATRIFYYKVDEFVPGLFHEPDFSHYVTAEELYDAFLKRVIINYNGGLCAMISCKINNLGDVEYKFYTDMGYEITGCASKY